MSTFNLALISAGFEHGGNVTHRHLDGHPDLLVYPFESQLGNREFNDFLASVERVQYRYPEFPEGLSASELYESIIDEEMKTFLWSDSASQSGAGAARGFHDDDVMSTMLGFWEHNPTRSQQILIAKITKPTSVRRFQYN